MALHPSRQPFVVALLKIDLPLGGFFGDALARFTVPYGGVGNTGDLFPPESPVLGFDAVDLVKHLFGDPFDPLIRRFRAAVQL